MYCTCCFPYGSSNTLYYTYRVTCVGGSKELSALLIIIPTECFKFHKALYSTKQFHLTVQDKTLQFSL